jgi:PAS domain S-box-containing protein
MMWEQFNSLLEDISDPVYLMDAEGNIRYFNAPARGVLGLEQETGPAPAHLSECHPHWAEAMLREEAIPAAMENGRWRGESALLTRTGIELPVSQTISAQRNAAGDVVHLTSVFKAETGRYFEDARRMDRLSQLETLVRLSKNVLQEKARSQVIQRVVSAACELTRASICLFCRLTADGGLAVEGSSEGCTSDSELYREIRRLLDRPGFLSDIQSRRSLRLVAPEFSYYFEPETSPDGMAPARSAAQGGALQRNAAPRRLRHLACVRLFEHQATDVRMILVGNADNVAFTPEDEAVLLHMAAFSGLALSHIQARQEAGRRSREMELIFSNLKEAVMVCDANGSPIMANPACVDSLGFDPTGDTCRNVSRQLKLVSPGGAPVLPEEMPFVRALRGEAVWDERYYGYDADGGAVVYVISSTPLYREDAVVGAVTVWRDETDLEKLTEQLIAEQSALQTIIRSAPEGIVVVDKECRITMANPTAVRLYGRSIPYGRSVSSHRELELLYPDGTPYEPMDLPLSRSVFFGEVLIDQEIAIARPEGGYRYLLVNTTPIKNQDSHIIGAVGVLHDITQRRSEKMQLQQDKNLLEKRVIERTAELETMVETLRGEIEERKRVEQQLRDSRRELREMSRRTLEALEADKQAVAKELHDSIGASLAAIKFSLEERVSAMQSMPREDAVSLEKIVNYLVYTIKETKRISAALRPTTLDDLGLMATIDWFCRDFGTFYNKIRVTQEVAIDESDLSDAMKIVIYRILQESMNNAAKHGNPGHIHFSLTRQDSAVRMVVKDDGCGFEPHSRLFASDPLSGHGIQGMRERAEICGGRFEIESSQGDGTQITLEIPMLTRWGCRTPGP